MHDDLSLPNVSDDPVLRFLWSGEAKTLQEAEEMYLDSACDEVVAILQQGLSDEELAAHPLMVMMRVHGSRGWEDSLA